uniref:(northern house mosquito) hypothetical protein n=1 Tax=Culex pipiens TaxID=7175 RepID=A0A8D8AMC3_CULPI
MEGGKFGAEWKTRRHCHLTRTTLFPAFPHHHPQTSKSIQEEKKLSIQGDHFPFHSIYFLHAPVTNDSQFFFTFALRTALFPPQTTALEPTFDQLKSERQRETGCNLK